MTINWQTKTVKAQQLWTTVLTAFALSSPAASPRSSWRAAEARFYSWRKLLSGHKHFFIHTRTATILKYKIDCCKTRDNNLWSITTTCSCGTRAIRAIGISLNSEGNCNGLACDVNLFGLRICVCFCMSLLRLLSAGLRAEGEAISYLIGKSYWEAITV